MTRPAPAPATRSQPAPPGLLRLRERCSIYLAIPNEQLEIRAREYGHAYVTRHEAAGLEANDVRQPGHTTYRFSSMERDQSDTAPEQTSKAT